MPSPRPRLGEGNDSTMDGAGAGHGPENLFFDLNPSELASIKAERKA